jgi:membrane-bound lytic murein transglycosylase F
MGFQYELIKQFAKENDWKLKLIILDDFDKAFEMLNRGEADILAADITKNKERNERVLLTEAHSYTKQVLVQRKSKEDSYKLKKVLDLDGKRVYVEKGTVFSEYLSFLAEQMAIDIKIIEDSIHTMEELVLMVAKGLIDYTVCDEHVAQINSTYLPNLDIDLELSPSQSLSWAVGKKQSRIKNKINDWLLEYKGSRKYRYTYSKYFKMKKTPHMIDDEFNTLRGGKLSPFDELIKAYSSKIDWDWRLLAALIYQESRFDTSAVSWAGAKGLMQIMPNTAQKFGVTDLSTPENSLKAGVGFLNWLDNQFKEEIPDSTERVKFILAAYNTGLGHVIDAQALANKYGRNPQIWESNVDTFMILKSNPKYYNDEVVKYGYSRGYQAYEFVEDIIGRYEQYRSVIPDE